MNFTNILKNVFADAVRIGIYRHLALHTEGLTGRALAALVNTSPFKINRELRHLVAQGIVTETVVGPAHLYRLQRDHVLVQQLIFPALEFERNCVAQLGTALCERLSLQPIAIIVYGSVARGNEHPQSDIDLLLLFSEIPNTDTHAASQVIAGVMESTVREWLLGAYNNPVSIRVMNIGEFQHRAVARDPFIKNIIKEGRTIMGLSLTEVLDYGRKAT